MRARTIELNGLSAARRLPRLGKIRLGVRVKKRAPDRRCQHGPDGMCNYCTYPRETDHFVVPPEVARVYGREPKELDIMVPVEDATVFFPQALEFYGHGRGLKCSGNGKVAIEAQEDGTLMERECPCERLEARQCQRRAHLSVILPSVNIGGVYQIDTGSINSIIDLNSSFDYIRALVGRVALVPIKLVRQEIVTHFEGKATKHYTLRAEFRGDVAFLNAARESTTRILSGPSFSLPPPAHDNPSLEDGAVVPEDSVADRDADVPSVDRAEQQEQRPAETAESAEAGTEHQREDVPVLATVESLLSRIGAARSVDAVNDALDASRSLPEAERARVMRSARERVKELRTNGH